MAWAPMAFSLQDLYQSRHEALLKVCCSRHATRERLSAGISTRFAAERGRGSFWAELSHELSQADAGSHSLSSSAGSEPFSLLLGLKKASIIHEVQASVGSWTLADE